MWGDWLGIPPQAPSLWGMCTEGQQCAVLQGQVSARRAATGAMSEEERLAAQGVPPEIIASMRTFNALAFSRPPPQARQPNTS